MQSLYYIPVLPIANTTVQVLLGNGANVREMDNYGWTALDYAAPAGCEETVLVLLNKGAVVPR